MAANRVETSSRGAQRRSDPVDRKSPWMLPPDLIQDIAPI